MCLVYFDHGCRCAAGKHIIQDYVVVLIPPKYAVSKFMGYLKGKLATRLFARYEQMSRRYWGRHVWSRGYCVSTLGLDEDQIRTYVKWQQQREKKLEATQDGLFD